MKFDEELDPRTTYNESFKPTDLGNKNYFPDDKIINEAKGENTTLMSEPNVPGILRTTYRRDYIKYDDAMCKFRKCLNARNNDEIIGKQKFRKKITISFGIKKEYKSSYI